MWRMILPFVQFAMDCYLGLGALAMVGFLGFGIGASITHRPYRRNGPSHRSREQYVI